MIFACFGDETLNGTGSLIQMSVPNGNIDGEF